MVFSSLAWVSGGKASARANATTQVSSHCATSMRFNHQPLCETQGLAPGATGHVHCLTIAQWNEPFATLAR